MPPLLEAWFTPLTPLVFLERSAQVYPEKTAIVYGDRRISYTEFAAAATRLAHALRASGVKPGDWVAYLLPNIPELLIAHFGVPLAGGVLVAMNIRPAAAEIRHICAHSGARLLVVDSALHPVIAPVVGELNVLDRKVIVTTAGAAPSPTIIGRMSELGARLVHVYGLTETYGQGSRLRRLRSRPSENSHRQDPEVSAARAGVAGPRIPSPGLARKKAAVGRPRLILCLILVKFQQRYQMRNRILSKAVPALDLCPFATPKTVSLWSAGFGGLIPTVSCSFSSDKS